MSQSGVPQHAGRRSKRFRPFSGCGAKRRTSTFTLYARLRPFKVLKPIGRAGHQSVGGLSVRVTP